MGRPIKYTPAALAFMAVLLILLVVMDGLIVLWEKKTLYDKSQEQAQNELELIGTFVTEPLLRQEFTMVEQFMIYWGDLKKDIIKIKAFTPDGKLLAEYNNASLAENTLTSRHSVKFVGRHLLDLETVKDQTSIMLHLQAFKRKLIFQSILATMFIGILLWIILRVLALRPLEYEIKKRKQVEEKLQHAHDNLEDIIAERTTELMETNIELQKKIFEKSTLESQLRQAQKMEAIGTLAGGIAHDFNNILTPIFGYTNLAFDKIPEGNPARKYLEQVNIAAKRAKDLVYQILAFSRQAPETTSPTKTQHIIKESLKLLRSSIPTTIKINQNIDTQCGTIMSDPTQIHQVVINLCTNAVHAMDEKGVLGISLQEVTLNAKDVAHKPGLKPGSYVCLSISDTGIGMDQKTINRIFEPYYTTKEVGKGTGIGLSVIHRIVENQKGMITVDSKPGKGTTFHVFLPLIEGEEPVSSRIFGPTPTGNERILYVDDEKLLTDLFGQLMKPLGYKVTTKTSSTEALKLFKSKPDDFDLLITDQSMPDLTGVEMAIEFLKIRPNMPIILCTGYSNKIAPKEAKEIGIKEFMMKPLHKRLLAATIRKVFDEK